MAFSTRRKLYLEEPPEYDNSSILEEWRLESSGLESLGLGGAGLPDDDVYLDKVQQILTGPPFIGVPPQPTDVYLNVFLGTQANAENLDLLRRMRFTHVLNCAGLPTTLREARARRYKDTNIRYQELALDDSEFAHLSRFLSRAHNFINNGQMYGKVLIHCTGVSRSGAIAISYLIRHGGERLLTAVKTVKDARRVALCNTGFMRQLVEYAREMRMLDPDPGRVRTPKYGRELDRRRILTSHIPTDLY